jgi:hypothetical protein
LITINIGIYLLDIFLMVKNICVFVHFKYPTIINHIFLWLLRLKIAKMAIRKIECKTAVEMTTFIIDRKLKSLKINFIK